MREDVQCLRGIAILFVFLYHLYPTTFPNGFLGVDIFFVISGYLIARNLDQNKVKNFLDLLHFYYRRLKRILPLYYLVILLAVVVIQLRVGEFYLDDNQRYSLAALFLASNQLVIHDQSDYFKEFVTDGSSANGFLHLWSLAVEVQFYLLVPFIFIALEFLKSDVLKLTAVILITVIGCIAFLLINVQFAFNFMLLRLWQFAAGFVAFYWEMIRKKETCNIKNEKDHPMSLKFPEMNPNDNKEEKTEAKHRIIGWNDLVAAAFALLFVSLIPYKINVVWFRPFVTYIVMFIVAHEVTNTKVRNASTLIYFGDMSYVVYMVHWPLIMIMPTSSFIVRFSCIVITMIVSVCLYHLYEKQYRKLEMRYIFALLVVLLAANGYLQYSIRHDDFWKTSYPPETQKIVHENKELLRWLEYPFDRKCKHNTSEPNIWCKHPPGHGKLSIMVVGNSYVYNLGPPIHDLFNLNYSDFRYMPLYGSNAIYQDPRDKKNMLLTKQAVELYQPDIIFIIAKHSESFRTPITENDTFVQQMNENIKFYEKIAKKVFIMGAHPLYPPNLMNLFLMYVTRKPDDLEQLHMNRSEADNFMKFVKKRLQMLKCDKCKVFDISQSFIEGNKYLVFDRETMQSYVDNTAHMTQAIRKPCRSVFQEIVDEALSLS